MSKQPTNGPYHWGNGPKPTRQAGYRKPSTHGCFTVVVAVAAPVVVALTWVAKEIFS